MKHETITSFEQLRLPLFTHRSEYLAFSLAYNGALLDTV